MDPETPSSAFNVDSESKQVAPVQGIPPVVNGFCENAVEAALQIKEAAGGGTVTVISVGNEFVMDVMKKPLSMGADSMVLIQDQLCGNLDALGTVNVLTEAIKRTGDFDLILCDQQASDWDNAHVPLGISEALDIPCLTEAKNIEMGDNSVTVNSSRADGYEVFEANLPALITVNNEIDIFKETLEIIPQYLNQGGKIAIISFHSIEDRIVKHFFKNNIITDEKNYYNPKILQHNYKFNVLTKKPIQATKEELKINNRSRSAKLRLAELL